MRENLAVSKINSYTHYTLHMKTYIPRTKNLALAGVLLVLTCSATPQTGNCVPPDSVGTTNCPASPYSIDIANCGNLNGTLKGNCDNSVPTTDATQTGGGYTGGTHSCATYTFPSKYPDSCLPTGQRTIDCGAASAVPVRKPGE